MSFLDEFEGYCQTHGVPARIELMLVDINGIIRGKWLDGKDAAKLADAQLRLPLSTYAPNIFGQEVQASGIGGIIGDPDGTMRPIAGSLAPVPWADGNVAQVLVELCNTDGQISALSSRQVLARVWAQYQAQNLSPVVASELEFHLLLSRADRTAPPQTATNLPIAQNYELEVMDNQSSTLCALRENAAMLDLPIDTIIAEYGPGQFEMNFHHSDNVLAAADQAVLFRRMVRATVAQSGAEATFAAKPFLDSPGNGMHLHASVLNGAGQNIFAGGDEQNINAALGYAIAGCLDTMAPAQAIFAPHGNSYRRFEPNSFAPTVPNWAIDHRGAGIRIPTTTGANARLEHRIAGADVNPYLAFAAILAGMLHGLERKPPPPLPLTDSKAKQAPSLNPIWANAMDQFDNAPFITDLLGPELTSVYSAVKRDEMQQLNNEIPPLERAAYIGRI